jgi:hypothetical protein
LERILDEVIVKDDSVANLEWTFSIDSGSVRAHQHSAGPGKGGCTTCWVEALAVDGARTADVGDAHPGQAGDNPQLLLLLDQIAVHRDGPGRARKLPERVSADKTCSRPSTRAALRSRGAPVGCAERGPQPGASLPSGRLNQGGTPQNHAAAGMWSCTVDSAEAARPSRSVGGARGSSLHG